MVAHPSKFSPILLFYNSLTKKLVADQKAIVFLNWKTFFGNNLEVNAYSQHVFTQRPNQRLKKILSKFKNAANV
jgi:hypothetical protein